MNAMGKIEWAMWANEQALASGLSEYSKLSKDEKRILLIINLYEQFDSNIFIGNTFFSCWFVHRGNDSLILLQHSNIITPIICRFTCVLIRTQTAFQNHVGDVGLCHSVES